jgi:hypothetical protein
MEKVMPLTAGIKIYLPPKGKFVLDGYDRATIKKASIQQKKKSLVKKRSLGSKGIKKVSFKDKKKGLKTRYKKV